MTVTGAQQRVAGSVLRFRLPGDPRSWLRAAPWQPSVPLVAVIASVAVVLGLTVMPVAGAPFTTTTSNDGSVLAMAAASSGDLHATGSNSNAQLGFAPSTWTPGEVPLEPSWAQVSTGLYHSCGVRSDGTLWCWGNNGNGRLGLGDMTQRTSEPVNLFGTSACRGLL